MVFANVDPVDPVDAATELKGSELDTTIESLNTLQLLLVAVVCGST